MPIPDILQQIVETKKSEVAAAKARVPEDQLRAQVGGGTLEQPAQLLCGPHQRP